MRRLLLLGAVICTACAHAPGSRGTSPHDDVAEAVVRVILGNRATACLRIDDRPPTADFLRRFSNDRVHVVQEGPACAHALYVADIAFTDGDHATARGGVMYAGGATFVVERTGDGWRVTGTRRSWIAAAGRRAGGCAERAGSRRAGSAGRGGAQTVGPLVVSAAMQAG